MSSDQQPLRIAGWERGIGESPHLGLGVIRNADIESFPGAVKVAMVPRTSFNKINTVTFTVVASTDICTASGTIEANGANFVGAAVYFTTTGTLPAGLSTGTVYFLIKVTTDTFKVAVSYKNSIGSAAGTQIDITDTGTGTHTMVQLAIGTIRHIIEDPRNNDVYMLDSNGRVWFAGSSTSTAYLLHNSAIENVTGALTNASGQGLSISPFSSTSKTFLFVFRNALVDVIDVFGTTAQEALSWTNGWQSLNAGAGDGTSHLAIKAQDQGIYFCDVRYVGSIIEVAGQTFDPATGSTFTYNNQALDLPPQEVAQCIEELGVDLLVGGNIFNKIYPWDRISDSFRLPLTVPEVSIKRLRNMGSVVYVLAGSVGNIYTTQGTYIKFFRRVPFYITNNSYSLVTNPITWGDIIAVNGALVIGLAAQTAAASGTYRLYPDGRLIHDNTPSTGGTNVTALWSKNNLYIMGYSGGADNFGGLAQYSASLPTIVQSGFMRVGTKTHKGTLSEIEVQLATPATSGSLRVSYRVDKSSSFTTIETYTMDSSAISFKSDLGLIDVESIQIQVEMHGDMEILEVVLYP